MPGSIASKNTSSLPPPPRRGRGNEPPGRALRSLRAVRMMRPPFLRRSPILLLAVALLASAVFLVPGAGTAAASHKLATPPNVRATVDDTTVTLYWDAVGSSTGYSIESGEHPAGTLSTVDVSGTTTWRGFGGLTNGKTYRFRVRAIADGDSHTRSDWSDWVTATPSRLFNVWSGTLTVGDGDGYKGYDSSAGVGTLPGASFTFDGVAHEIERLSLTDSGTALQLVLDKAIPDRLKSSLRLTVGSIMYSGARATLGSLGGTTNDSATWAVRPRRWNVGDEVTIIVSSTDIWSATLTVRSTFDGISRGCDSEDGQTTPRPSCSTYLTDDTFTYGGADYEINALVQQSPGEAHAGDLQLLLNKTIPDSLGNLVLHVDDRRFLLADGKPDTSTQQNDLKNWPGAGLNWSLGDTVKVRLTERQPPKSQVFFRPGLFRVGEVSGYGMRRHVERCVRMDPPLGSGGSSVYVRINPDSTATQGDDYTLHLPNAPGTTTTKVLTLPQGATQKCFGLTFKRDGLTEGQEQLNLELVAIADAPYVLVDDFTNTKWKDQEIYIDDYSQPIPLSADPNRGISVQPRSATVQQGSTVSYTVSLNSRPDHDVAVTAWLDERTSNLGDVAEDELLDRMRVSPASLTFTPTNWAVPQTFTLSPRQAPPGRYLVFHGLESQDQDYDSTIWFHGPGIDGRTHIEIEVTASGSPGTDGELGSIANPQGDSSGSPGTDGELGSIAAPQQPASPQTDYADLIAQMKEWRNDPRWVRHKSHTDRWDRALKAFGETVADDTLTAMSAAEAQGYADQDWGTRWVDVAAALKKIEADASAAPSEPDPHADLIAQMKEWRNDPQWVHHKEHTDRWDRALKAFGETVPDDTLTAMSAAEAQGFANQGWERWVDVAAALRKIEGG